MCGFGGARERREPRTAGRARRSQAVLARARCRYRRGTHRTCLCAACRSRHRKRTDAMLVEAKKLAKARGLANFRTARARAEDLPFPDMSFDLVTCRLAAHHFENTGAFAEEAFRVLMPNGVFALVDNVSPNSRDWPAVYNDFEK